MIRSWFAEEFVGFVRRSAASAMGCFFGCFRVRDARPPLIHLVAEPFASTSSITKEPVQSLARNPLSSFLQSDAEDEYNSPSNDERSRATGSLSQDFDAQQLKEEAKFLKAWGTLSETPVEIRRNEKLKDSTPRGESESSKFHSWLSKTTIQKLNLKEQPDQAPSPSGLLEEQMNHSNSSARLPSSCITGQDSSTCCSEGNDVGIVDTLVNHMQSPTASSVSFTPPIARTQRKNKCVHFDCQTDSSSIYTSSDEGCKIGSVGTLGNQMQDSATASFTPMVSSVQPKSKFVRFECQSNSSFSSKGSSSEVATRNSKKFGHSGDNSVSKPSPYPTPLKLTDDMQTPGTEFPSNLHNQEMRMNYRIKAEYVYPSVINPIKNFPQSEELAEESSSDQLKEYLEQDYNETPKPEVGTRGNVVDKESNLETTLASWLQPKTTNQEVNNQSTSSNSQELPAFRKTPGDRPILGIVAAHWNEDDTSRISPKWWDGNGIPNSTNKYKEDQKVSWHATPFEERLEKALSEDKLIAERKQLGRTPPIEFDADEVCSSNSVVSQLPPLSHFKSAVSF